MQTGTLPAEPVAGSAFVRSSPWRLFDRHANPTGDYQPQGHFSATGEEALPDHWWLTFDDPTLDQLVEPALSDNLSLQTAWDRLDQARAVARRAGADLCPQLNGEAVGSSSRLRSDSNDDSSQTSTWGSRQVTKSTSGGVNSTQEAAELDALASAEALQTAAADAVGKVASTWFELIEQRGQIKILEQQLHTNEQALELISLQFRTGQISIADLLQQRQVVESRRGERALARAGSRCCRISWRSCLV